MQTSITIILLCTLLHRHKTAYNSKDLFRIFMMGASYKSKKAHKPHRLGGQTDFGVNMDFNRARFCMVEQQIRPWEVLNFDLLDVLGEVPRERFVREQDQAVAYADKALPLPNGGMMLEPKVVARLIQSLDLSAVDRVLEIGTGSGYATAVLAKMAGNVTTVDSDAAQQKRASTVLSEIGCDNITYQVGDGLIGLPRQNQFSAVYVGGSVPEIPQRLLDALPEGGRMAVIVGTAPVMHAKLITRKEDKIHEQILFETVAPALSSALLPTPSAFAF